MKRSKRKTMERSKRKTMKRSKRKTMKRSKRKSMKRKTRTRKTKKNKTKAGMFKGKGNLGTPPRVLDLNQAMPERGFLNQGQSGWQQN